ncbi:hypothetical protein BJY01DRAFT_229981 [Aspergillus pseudoustus]|uniref:Uncharacterized protein n=1 Tax=Aspergillus pseudoustus TaxID=1810923 RepID=A0ABR4IE63_9EURO
MGSSKASRPFNPNLFVLPGIYVALTGTGAGRPSLQRVASVTNSYGLRTVMVTLRWNTAVVFCTVFIRLRDGAPALL